MICTLLDSLPIWHRANLWGFSLTEWNNGFSGGVLEGLVIFVCCFCSATEKITANKRISYVGWRLPFNLTMSSCLVTKHLGLAEGFVTINASTA